MSLNGQVLADVCEFIVDCEHKTAPTQEEGYPSIRTPNIGRGRLILDGVNRVSEETYLAWTRRATPQADDLILAREAPVGNVAIVPSSPKVCLGQRTVLIRPDRSKVVPAYLICLLLGDQIQGVFRGYSSGATVGHLNVKDIRNLKLPSLPSLPVQQKIAAIHSTYDDLIGNNTRRIRILEEMAQTIYREWFVNFRFPGHQKVCMVNSPMGKIPQGWRFESVHNCLEHYIGGGWGEDANDESHPVAAYVIRGTDIPDARHGCIADCPLRYHTESNFLPRRLQDGDIVFEVSGGGKDTSVGRSLLVSSSLLNELDKPAICASFCKLLRPNPSVISPELLYMHLVEMYSNGIVEKYQVQSTGIKNFKFTVFAHDEQVILPSTPVSKEFQAQIVPLLSAVQSFGRRNVLLRQTRDLLLPKLISGEVDVSGLNIGIPEVSA